ncbi:prefoldin subunit 4-like [Amphiura filiformis]|uniref:prefoldin subunit 4-like n=1 Tax=Amphiura filiformis TaxID=82378 RepID=UPI003B227EC5
MATLVQKPGSGIGKGDDGVSVTFEDQQKINVYARKCNKLAELQEEIKTKKKELENLQDACDELELADDDIHIPYQIGEVFVSQNLEETQALVEQAKTRTQGEIDGLEQQCKDIKATLSNLKGQLYAKFGNNINLELEMLDEKCHHSDLLFLWVEFLFLLKTGAVYSLSTLKYKVKYAVNYAVLVHRNVKRI